MKFQVKLGDIKSIKCDAIILNLFEGVKVPSGATAVVDKALGNAISDLIKTGELKGKPNEIQVIHTLGKMPARLVLVVGLGKKEEFATEKLRNAMGEAVRALRQHSCKSAATVLHDAGDGGVDATEAAQAIAGGCLLGLYQFRKHLTKKDEQKEIDELTILEKDASKQNLINKGLIVEFVSIYGCDNATFLTEIGITAHIPRLKPKQAISKSTITIKHNRRDPGTCLLSAI